MVGGSRRCTSIHLNTDSTFPAIDIETGKPFLWPKGHEKEGEPLFYRRFIPARLTDNPYLLADGQYEAMLRSLPEVERKRLLKETGK